MIMVVVGSANLGGSEVLALNLARWMLSSRIPCELVFLSSEPGPARSRAERFGIAIHDIDEAALSRLGFVWTLRRLLRARAADHVLAFMFGVHLYVGLAARLAGVKKLLAFVGNPASRDKRQRRRMKIRARIAQPFTSKVVSCSTYVADSIIPAYGLRPEKVHVIHNWCDVETISSRAQTLRSQSVGHEVVGMIARMDPIKDHPALLRAFAEVARDRPQVTLRLAGDGPTRPAVAEMIADLGLSDRVHLVGAIEDAAAELAKLTLFVFATTRDEGFGLVLVEAMAAGVPIVAVDVGPVTEVLDGQRGGRVVRSNHPELLGAAISSVLDDAEGRSKMIRDAYELAREKYSVELAGPMIKALLDA